MLAALIVGCIVACIASGDWVVKNVAPVGSHVVSSPVVVEGVIYTTLLSTYPSVEYVVLATDTASGATVYNQTYAVTGCFGDAPIYTQVTLATGGLVIAFNDEDGGMPGSLLQVALADGKSTWDVSCVRFFGVNLHPAGRYVVGSQQLWNGIPFVDTINGTTGSAPFVNASFGVWHNFDTTFSNGSEVSVAVVQSGDAYLSLVTIPTGVVWWTQTLKSSSPWIFSANDGSHLYALYFPSESSLIVGTLDLYTGTLAKQSQAIALGTDVGTWVGGAGFFVVGDSLVVTDSTTMLVVLRRSTLKVLWSINITGVVSGVQPSLDSTVVCFAPSASIVTCYDPITGDTPALTFNVPPAAGTLSSFVVVGQTLIGFGSNNVLFSATQSDPFSITQTVE